MRDSDDSGHTRSGNSSAGIAAPARDSEIAKQDIPFAPDGWRSVYALMETYAGEHPTLTAAIERLLEEKKKTATEQAVFKRWGGIYRNAETSRATLHASPAAIGELEESGKLVPKIKPYAPDGWMSVHDLPKHYSGVEERLRKKVKIFARQQEAVLLNEGRHTPMEAQRAVAKRWAGFYRSRVPTGKAGPFAPVNGQKAELHVSQEARDAMEASGMLTPKDKLPPPEWVSAASLQNDHVGGSATIDRKMKQFCREKTRSYIAEGFSKDIAQGMVRRIWGDIYISVKSGGGPVFFVSPRTVRAMKQTGELVPAGTIPQAPQNWESGQMLEERYIGGHKRIKKDIAAFIERKTDELIKNGVAPEAAEKTVHGEWAGLYLGGSEATLYLSPKGIEALEQSGRLIPQENLATLGPPPGWQSASMLVEKYDGNVTAMHRLMTAFLDERKEKEKARLAASGKTEEQAEKRAGNIVSGSWGRICRNETHQETLYISVRAVALLEAAGMLVPLDKSPPAPSEASPSHANRLEAPGESYARDESVRSARRTTRRIQ